MYFQAHGAEASEVGNGTRSCFHAAMSVFSRVVLKTLLSGPRHQGVKCFRARSQSAMVLFPCSKTRIAVFGTLIAPAVKDAFQKQRSLAVTTQEFR